jgi:hypothetical protein
MMSIGDIHEKNHHQKLKLLFLVADDWYFCSLRLPLVVAAREAGFKPTTPMIDLFGQSPRILYSIGAENIGQAWTIGGYPDSLKLAETAIVSTPCEKISTAWILSEQDGPRSIPTELMIRLGADFPDSYKHVGTWQTAEGAGGYPNPRTQDLYKPIEQHKTLMAYDKLREELEQ